MNLDEIKLRLKNEDHLVRCDAVTELAQYNDDPVIFDMLVDMLDDKNYLVRCEAYEALYDINSQELLDKLISKLKREKSSTVRMYILSNISRIITNIGVTDSVKTELTTLFENETIRRVIVNYLTVFYVIYHDVSYIEKALKYINDEEYHMRHVVINSVYDVVDENILNMVLDSYKERLKIETAFSVSELLRDCIKELEK